MKGAAVVTALFGLAAAFANPACDNQAASSYERSFTSTVSLGKATRLSVELWLPAEIIGRPSRTDIRFDVDATVTASSSTVARQLAEALELSIRAEGSDVFVILPPPAAATSFTGTVRIEMPSAIALAAKVHEGTATVTGLEKAIAVTTAYGARVDGAEEDVIVGVAQGPASVDAWAKPGSKIEVEVLSGSVLLTLPESVSAKVDAEIRSSGSFDIQHPALPRAFGGNRYRAEVNGGLSSVRVLMNMGNVSIRPR